MMNMEKLVIRNCVMMISCLVMLLCTDRHVQSVEIFDKMENCGTVGRDFDTD
jgi:hypothetical protein